MKEAQFNDYYKYLTYTQKKLVEVLFKHRNSCVRYIDVISQVDSLNYVEGTKEYNYALNRLRQIVFRLNQVIDKKRLPFRVVNKRSIGLTLLVNIESDNYVEFCDYYILKQYDRCDKYKYINIIDMGDLEECKKCRHRNHIYLDEERLQ